MCARTPREHIIYRIFMESRNWFRLCGFALCSDLRPGRPHTPRVRIYIIDARAPRLHRCRGLAGDFNRRERVPRANAAANDLGWGLRATTATDSNRIGYERTRSHSVAQLNQTQLRLSRVHTFCALCARTLSLVLCMCMRVCVCAVFMPLCSAS